MKRENNPRFLRSDADYWRGQARGWKWLSILLSCALLVLTLWHNSRIQGTKGEIISESETTSSALTSAEYDTRMTSDMITEDPVEDTVSVPVLLNASCTAWTDQYGNVMSIEDADAFFSDNRYIAEDIRQLNGNSYYATRLYSPTRCDFLTESWHKWYSVWMQEADETYAGRSKTYAYGGFSDTKGNLPAVSDKALQEIYLSLISEQRPSISSLNSLKERLRDNFAAGTIQTIIQDCDAQEYTKDFHCSLSERLFFACLAKFNENGTMDVLCDQPTGRIPSMLLADGTWYDQDGNVMGKPEIYYYFHEHEASWENLEDMFNDLQRKREILSSYREQPKVMKSSALKEPSDQRDLSDSGAHALDGSGDDY